jgi:hypothetical protein
MLKTKPNLTIAQHNQMALLMIKKELTYNNIKFQTINILYSKISNQQKRFEITKFGLIYPHTKIA